MIRTIVFWGLYWGPLILRNYHLRSRPSLRLSLQKRTRWAWKCWRTGACGLGVSSWACPQTCLPDSIQAGDSFHIGRTSKPKRPKLPNSQYCELYLAQNTHPTPNELHHFLDVFFRDECLLPQPRWIRKDSRRTMAGSRVGQLSRTSERASSTIAENLGASINTGSQIPTST